MNQQQINILFCFLTAAVLLSGCGKEEPKKDFVARVNDSYLTSEEISGMKNSSSYSNYYEEELIRNWIKREVLYQTALDEGLIDDAEFKKLIDDSKKELAAAFILRKYFEEESVIYEPKDIQDYFEKNKSNFQLLYDSYLLNIISFKDEDKAVRFRQTAIESDWNKALNVFKGDSSISKDQTKSLFYEHDIHPVLLLRIVKELYPDEISIILEYDPGNYSVVQVVDKFQNGTIPPFETIKDRVENKFHAYKKESALKEYLDQLYSDFEIEVKN